MDYINIIPTTNYNFNNSNRLELNETTSECEEHDCLNFVGESEQNVWANHGYVFSLGDGIIVVHGLYRVTAGEMVFLIAQILLVWLSI